MKSLIQDNGTISIRFKATKGHLAILLIIFGAVHAGAMDGANAPPDNLVSALHDERFKPGQIEGTVGTAVMFSPVVATHNRPTFNFATALIQAGFMLNEPSGHGFWRGNFETLVEGFGAGLFSGRGNYLAGTTLWMRYNFLRPQSRFAPYSQLGGGVLLTDIDRKIVGQAFNFNLDAGFGSRWFLKSTLALNLEYRFQHISNAGMGPHNLGINAHGPMLGLSWFF